MWPTISFLVLVAVLIIWHEFGHLGCAKIFGVGVKRVSLGFGKILFSKRISRTEYSLSLIPFGGYVRMYGEPYANEDETLEDTASGKNISYRGKAPWKRVIIVLAGPVANLLLSLMIFVSISIFAGAPEMKAKIGEVYDYGPAKTAGLEPGDQIIGVSGEKVKYWKNFTEAIQVARDRRTLIDVIRNGKTVVVCVVPEIKTSEGSYGNSETRYVIGVKASMEYVYIKAPFIDSVLMGVERTHLAAKTTLLMLGQVITGKLTLKHISGPLRIAQLSALSANSGTISFLTFLAIISIGLAIMNMLPIPVLDGGHLLFLIYEMVTGNALSKRSFEISTKLGITAVSMIMCLALYNDLSRIF